MWRCVLLLCAVTTVHCARSDPKNEDPNVRLVKTSQGIVRGHKDPESGVFAFYSIPYATAPIGAHRYKAPLPGPAWLQPLDAVDKGIVCPQIDNPYLGAPGTKKIQEDCLVTSIYVPDTDEKKLPVVVYVHGGAFQIGFGDTVPPTNFVKNKKIIAVTFNYRLGVNGFLCLGTSEAPGNAGLKDQVALLRWVKRNIAAFGGDPDNVTILGASAGAMSVDLLMLSKTTRGLFNKIIPESGVGLSVLTMQIDPIENAKNVALQLGFTNVDDIYALEKFYMDTSLDTLLQNVKVFNSNSTMGFVPCVERDTGTEVILDDAPVNIIRERKNRKLPMLLGFDNMEGILQIANFADWKEKMNESFSAFLPADLQFENELEKESVAKIVKEFYFGEKTIDENTILGFVDYFTDVQFAYPAVLSANLHVEAGNEQIYLYEYSFVDEYTQPVPHTNVRGANHCDQTMHVMDGKKYINPEAKESEEYKNIQGILQDMWYNFIKTGKPVPESSSLPEWPAVGAAQSPHMSLGTKVELRGSLMQDRVQFWNEIYSKYYRTPVAPPHPPPRPHTEL